MAMAMATPTTFLTSRKISSSSDEQHIIYRRLRKLKLRVSAHLHKNKKREFKLHSFSVAPLFTLALSTKPIYETFNTWALSEQEIKNIYIVFAILFCFGCCVAGSMNDPFYDSEEYRRDGGDGTGNWQYIKQEREEREAREELWREELQRELEEKTKSLKQVEEKDKELV